MNTNTQTHIFPHRILRVIFQSKRFSVFLCSLLFLHLTLVVYGQNDSLEGSIPDSSFTPGEEPSVSIFPPDTSTSYINYGKELLQSAISEKVYSRCTSYGLGWANVFDTYLSPQAYHGIEFRFMRESMPDAYLYPSHRSWLRQSLFQGFTSYTKHPSGDNTEISIMGEWRWGYLYNFKTKTFCPQLELQAGGQLYGQGGLIYNLANGNNPVALKLGVGIGATGTAAYHFDLGKRSFTARYQLFVPTLGVLFSPHYGQSYYEIFSLGNSGGVVHFASLYNQPSFWQHLSLDFPLFRKTTLRLSYVADIRQTKVYDLKYHQWSHCFLLGIVHRFRKIY